MDLLAAYDDDCSHLRTQAVRAGVSATEDRLSFQLRAAGIEHEREYHAIPARRYRWDFALVEARVLIEVQGGIWMRDRTGHTTGKGVRRDCEKANLAALHGWRTLFFTSDMVESGEAVRVIDEVIRWR